MAIQETPITADGLQKLQEQLDELVNVRRPEISARIKEARELGDLKENAEYHDAKNEQSLVETRIQTLESRIRTARVIEATDASKVTIGTTVKLTDLESGDHETWQITGVAEADPLDQKISFESPLGKALQGKKQGDEVEVPVPAGMMRMRVDSIAVS
jgi:transcription elongation factor GreA